MTILIADDNATNRKLLRLLLDMEGHEVLEADNGAAALNVLEHRRVDAVISDILMPEMDGFRLCYEIRKHPRLKHLPFIVYTASYTSANDEKLAMTFGADRFIRKPASAETIINGLYESLAIASTHERPDATPEEAAVMREYSQVLVRKLQHTIDDLSQANKKLAEKTALAEFVTTVSTALAQETRLREMLQLCCAAMVQQLDLALARIWTCNEKAGVLELQASAGMYTRIDGEHARVPVGQFEIGMIAAERKPLLTNRVIGNPRVHDQEWAKREGLVAVAGYPLMVGDQVVGVMAAFSRKNLSQSMVDVMGSVAKSIAVGIQRQFAESELRLSEERFRALAENVNEIFYIIDPQGRQLHYVSPAYEQITGQSCAALYQDPRAWLEFVHPDDREKVKATFRARSGPLNQEYRIVRPDGESRWLRSRSFPVKDEHGALARVVGIATDITEQKQAEHRVNQNLDRIRALHDVNLAITTSLELPTILQTLLAKIETLFPYPTASTVRLLNHATGALEALACHNMDREDWTRSFTYKSGGRAFKVLQSKDPLIVPNVLDHPETVNPALFQKYGLVSYVGLPLIAEEEPLGVLNFYTREPHEFTGEEIEFLVTIASQAAVAIHNARLYEETRRAQHELENTNQRLGMLLHQLGSLYATLAPIAPAATIEEMLGGIIDRIMEATGADAVSVRISEGGPGGKPVVSQRGYSDEFVKWVIAAAPGSAVDWVLRHGEPLIATDLATDRRFRKRTQTRLGLLSCAILPLTVNNQVRGAIHVSSRETGYFDEAQRNHLNAIARQMSIALENRELFNRLNASRSELERANAALTETNRMLSALHAVAAAASQSLAPQRILEAAVGKISEIFDFDATRIHLLDSASGELVREASREKQPERFTTVMRFMLGEGILGRVAQSGQALVFEDTASDPRYSQWTQTARTGKFNDRFFAVFPIRSKSGTLGTLACIGHEPRRLSVAEIQLLEAIADQLAVAIENARLFERNEASRRELKRANAFLNKSLKQLASLYTAMLPLAIAESPDQMFDGIVDRLIEATGSDAALIRIWSRNDGDFPVIAQRGYTQEYLARVRPGRTGGAIEWVMENGELIIAPDIAAETRLRGKGQLAMGLKSCAILPLRVHGEILGVIHLASRTPRYFEIEQRDHLMTIARQMSIALENRELYCNLQVSSRELEKASKVKDEFLAVMSHELRTPLSVVLGYSGVIGKKELGPLTPEQELAMEVILRNARELSRMIESIMDATKIEAGSMSAEKDPVAVAGLLEEIKLAYDFPTAKNIGFEWHYSDRLPLLWTDARKLRQILTNLINNAIKFADGGRVSVTARENRDFHSGVENRWIEFEVADNGIGIPPSECQRIFERFHQVDGSGTRRFEGVGLGLYIVKSFTELLGGQVTVESELGKGSKFTVRLPLIPVA
jgi:PAS domain S-box-containing protein